MDSILSQVVILNKDLVLEDGSTIASGTWGHIISLEYLKSSNFSPDDFEGLLREAEQAKLLGFLYVDFKTCGKCVRVHPDLVL